MFFSLQDWYLELNPKGEVPTLRKGDRVVVESTDIVEFVDRNYGRPYLLYPHDDTKGESERGRDGQRKIYTMRRFKLTFP